MPVLFARLLAASSVALILITLGAAAGKAQNAEGASDEAQAEPSNIEKRLRRIEDSLIDMRAMIGALQSFAPGDGSPRAQQDRMAEDDLSGEPFGQAQPSQPTRQGQAPAEQSAELQQLELQVQALSAQLSETVKRLNKLEKAIRSEQSEAADTASAQSGAESGNGGMAAPDSEASEQMGFGTTTVQTPDTSADESSTWPDTTMNAQFDEAGSPEAQAVFAQAYDALQAEDYAAARDGFERFLQTYPDDPLANDARFWLADAAFASRDYVVAANNFVKVYNAAPTGEKSEQTLLKLAIVLRRLDRPESACDALSRLDGRLDAMPDTFRQRVKSERQRSGCG